MLRSTLRATVFLSGLTIAVAGSLDPSGPPAPTMKPLDMVEPRVPISSVPFTISAPGSYYLTQNLTIAPGSISYAITVSSDNVVLDLAGFSLSGAGNLLGAGGIDINFSNNVIIRNGTIRDFTGTGVSADGGTAPAIHGVVLEDLVVGNCGTPGSYGGIYLVSGIVRRCTVHLSKAWGIFIFREGLVEDTVSDGNSLWGISAGSGTIVRGCVVRFNSGDGILFSDRAVLIGNTAWGNNGSGIRSQGLGEARIEDNHLVSNLRYGIEVTVAGNFIARNTARGNSLGSFSIVAGNVAPVETGTATGAWSNISF